MLPEQQQLMWVKGGQHPGQLMDPTRSSLLPARAGLLTLQWARPGDKAVGRGHNLCTECGTTCVRPSHTQPPPLPTGFAVLAQSEDHANQSTHH